MEGREERHDQDTTLTTRHDPLVTRTEAFASRVPGIQSVTAACGERERGAATPRQSRDSRVASTRPPWSCRGARGQRGRGCSVVGRRRAWGVRGLDGVEGVTGLRDSTMAGSSSCYQQSSGVEASCARRTAREVSGGGVENKRLQTGDWLGVWGALLDVVIRVTLHGRLAVGEHVKQERRKGSLGWGVGSLKGWPLYRRALHATAQGQARSDGNRRAGGREGAGVWTCAGWSDCVRLVKADVTWGRLWLQ